MPAEWEKHQRTFLEWPVRESLIWKENYSEVCEGYAETARAIAGFEPVTVIVNPGSEQEAESLCGDFARLVMIPHNDAWIRDNGPTFVWDNEKRLSGISWNFNAWGEKYTPYNLDDAVARRLLAHFHVPCLQAGIVLEGGSIHVDGQGTLLTTEQCLLNPNRNPQLSREQIEEVLKQHLNISKIIWLKRGLFGDETDGHVDNVACFAKPGVVLLQSCHDPEDPNFGITRENLDSLHGASDAMGRSLEVVEIPQPPARLYNGVRLTLSYLNFYFVNGGIVLPVFGGDAAATDRRAKEILRKIFPDRTVAAVDGMKLIKEGGNVHCITQQMPEGN
jgi:agmatine deiminase